MKPAAKPAKAAPNSEYKFTIEFASGKKEPIAGDKVNSFISTSDAKYVIRDSKGTVIFRKTFKG